MTQGSAMSAPLWRALPSTAGKLSIGALSRATGIPIETLRTWERRYGFPVPERKPSGHRVYSLASVPRLRRIAEALGRGHRAAEVVTATEADLSQLLEATPASSGQALPSAYPSEAPRDCSDLLRAVEHFDGAALTHQLMADWTLLGPVEFLRVRVAPLIRAVGDAWQARRLDVQHEHFLSERIGDLIRTLRLRFEERAVGPLVVLATLPGESHGLGLQMATLVLVVAGCRTLYLGTDVPVPEIAAVAKNMGARAVAISVSSARAGRVSTAHLRRLRALLSRRVTLLVGGDGAPKARKGMDVIQDLTALEGWASRLVRTPVSRDQPAPRPERTGAGIAGEDPRTVQT
jgi:DNA-binding transcriptional MerR regulator/methylmalonyl-CoA mutase cobalamin-binding subunit